MIPEKKPDYLSICPVCRGRIHPFQGPNNHTMGTCEDCGYSYVVPATAWDTARNKRPDAQKRDG